MSDQKNRPLGQGLRKSTKRGMGYGGSDYCVCPQCGHKEEHERGIPCAQKKCPKCGARMMGEICEDAFKKK